MNGMAEIKEMERYLKKKRYFSQQSLKEVDEENNETFLNACKNGDRPYIKYVLEKKMCVSYDEGYKMAILNNQLNVVKCLSEWINSQSFFKFQLPMLKMACFFGYLEIVKYLYEQGMDIHVFADELFTFSSSVGQKKIVEFLFQKGAEVDKKAMRAALTNGHNNVVEYLVSVHGRKN